MREEKKHIKSEKHVKNEKHVINIVTIQNGKEVISDIEAESLDDAKEFINKIKDENTKFIIYDEHERIIFSGIANEHKHYKSEEHNESHGQSTHYHHDIEHEHHHHHHDDDDDSYA